MNLALLAATVTALGQSVPYYAVEKTIPVPGDGGWDCLSIDSPSHRLFITRGTHVQVLDVESGKVVGDILNTQGVHGVVIVPRLRKVYITNGRDDSVSVIDLRTLKELKRIKVGKRPDVILFDPSSSRVFSFNAGDDDTTAIDVRSDSVAGSVKLGGKPEFAASDGHGTIFVNLEDKSRIECFDARKLVSERAWPLAPGEEPTGLAIDVKRHLLYSACGNGIMAVTNSESGKVVATPKIGAGPDGAAFDPASGLVFSPNGQDGTLTVIGRDFSVLETVPTQRGARTMALDLKTHKLYLMAAKYEPATEGRPRMVPGSAVIVVVSPVKP